MLLLSPHLTTRRPGWETITYDTPYKGRYPKFWAWKIPIIQESCETVFYTGASTTFNVEMGDILEAAELVLASDAGLGQVEQYQERFSAEFRQTVNIEEDSTANAQKTYAWLRDQPDYKEGAIQPYNNEYFCYDPKNVHFQQVSTFFWDRYSLESDSWKEQPLWDYALYHHNVTPALLRENMFVSDTTRERDGGNTFKILCTAPSYRRMRWGSYVIRCVDMKMWAARCAKDVWFDLRAHGEIEKERETYKRKYDTAVSIKQPLLESQPDFGQIYVDVVDEYDLSEEELLPETQVIVQNRLHAQEKFSHHTFHVVEHWYNSYPADAFSDTSSFSIPDIPSSSSSTTILKIATVWTNQIQPCPAIDPELPGVQYDCIDEVYNIEAWYERVFREKNIGISKEDIESFLQDPELGQGRLYYELFRQYDALVIPTKTASPPKLRYGNAQRALSQMRSGVPVLVEVKGFVMEDFMREYNYTCAYTMDRKPNAANKRQYWSFREGVEAMKNPDLRKRCREEGLRISSNFSPNRIAMKHLRALGYKGDFTCS